MTDCKTSGDLVAVALANPGEFPAHLVRADAAVVHDVPISAHRPPPVPRAELGWYTDRQVLDGTRPDTLV